LLLQNALDSAWSLLERNSGNSTLKIDTMASSLERGELIKEYTIENVFDFGNASAERLDIIHLKQ